MSEFDDAVALANRVLDKPWIDPDGDICLLARQFLRSVEWQAMRRLEAIYVEKLAHYAAEKARGNLTEDWGECAMRCARLTLEDIRWEIHAELPQGKNAFQKERIVPETPQNDQPQGGNNPRFP